jgi:hypothetical protein
MVLLRKLNPMKMMPKNKRKKRLMFPVMLNVRQMLRDKDVLRERLRHGSIRSAIKMNQMKVYY